MGLRLVSTVVLTRLLAPEVYGVFATVLVCIYLLEMFSDLGLRSLVLTKEGDVSDRFMRTCWTVSILRGLIIALFSVFIAIVIGVMQNHAIFSVDSAYSAAVLPWAIVALGIVPLIQGFQSPLKYISERHMEFGRVTLVHVTNNIVGLVVTIALAYYLRSIWALVLGYAAKSIAQVALSFLAFRGAPMRLSLNRDDLSILVSRGKWIMGHSAMSALAQSADRLVLGFVMTSTTFGFYFIARQIVDIFWRFMTTLNSQMGLQVFTYLQKSEPAVFRRNYYRYRLFFDMLSGLIVGGVTVLAPLLVEIIFDDRYQGVAPIVQILIWSILLIGPMLLRDAFSAERRFKRMTFLSLVTTGTLWSGLGITIFAFDSIPAALMVIALYRLPEAMIITVLAGDRDWVIVWREFVSFVFCAIGALAGWGILWLWKLLI